MIAHIVLLKPKSNLPPEDRRAFVAAFERAVREIPSVRGVRIGTRVMHGAGYEQTMPDTGAFVAVIDFDGGGRFACDLTDVDAEELSIGDRVEMTFRRISSGDGIHNYFWKARPIRIPRS